MKRAAIHLRVSTIDQTTANQEHELRQIAERAGWEVAKVYKDHGISGATFAKAFSIHPATALPGDSHYPLMTNPPRAGQGPQKCQQGITKVTPNDETSS
jgi:hypothetical protein